MVESADLLGDLCELSRRTLVIQTGNAAYVVLMLGRSCYRPFRRIACLTMKTTATIHETHHSIVKRLRRAEGHLHRVITMFADGRSCLDLAQQLYAVERAVAQAKKELIRDHIDHCLEIAANGEAELVSGVVSEFKAISRYL